MSPCPSCASSFEAWFCCVAVSLFALTVLALSGSVYGIQHDKETTLVALVVSAAVLALLFLLSCVRLLYVLCRR